MNNHLKAIKLINCKESLLEYCMWTMELIGSGSGRSVFVLSDELVLKVSRNEAGRRQNEVESNSNNEMFANIYQHDKNYLWCIMDRVYPITKEDFDNITGTTRDDRMIWLEYKAIEMGSFNEEIKKLVEDRYMAKDDNWVNMMETNEFSNQLLNVILTHKLEAGDLFRYDSWGVSKDNPDKPILFDYGLSHSVWIECYIRHDIRVKHGSEIIKMNALERVEELNNTYIKVNIDDKVLMLEKVY